VDGTAFPCPFLKKFPITQIGVKEKVGREGRNQGLVHELENSIHFLIVNRKKWRGGRTLLSEFLPCEKTGKKSAAKKGF